VATPTDNEIIRQVLEGDERRYSLLVDRHKDRAMTLALRILANREEAEEAVQDAFVRAFRGLGRFRGVSQFPTWFYRILYNVALSALKRRGKMQQVSYDDEHGIELDQVHDDAGGLLAGLEQRQMVEMVEEELRGLPERYRVVLTLFYVQEMKYEEIASVLGLPMGTVKTLLFRGRESLRQTLAARLEQEVVIR
jgi:RNA polymerase sigma-70 factor (ECF subfamily)